ncbi:hypothetical protein Ddc_10843 [Ditylenchus destructor]|nr:hypothetical protein Ddc_10843 [Ditylenchus destructor]
MNSLNSNRSCCVVAQNPVFCVPRDLLDISTLDCYILAKKGEAPHTKAPNKDGTATTATRQLPPSGKNDNCHPDNCHPQEGGSCRGWQLSGGSCFGPFQMTIVTVLICLLGYSLICRLCECVYFCFKRFNVGRRGRLNLAPSVSYHNEDFGLSTTKLNEK